MTHKKFSLSAPSRRSKPVGRSACINVKATCEADKYPAVARTLMRPEVGAASAIEQWQNDTHDVNDLANELAAQVDAVNGGDLRRAEGMLIAQAHTLNNVFNVLLRRATTQQYLPQWEAYMRMGMKAQSQCRSTLEALSELKNPRAVAFVKQANFANGNQHVNNGGVPNLTDGYEHTPAGKMQTEPSKLLEASNVQRLDTGAESATGRANKDFASVGAFNRANNAGR